MNGPRAMASSNGERPYNNLLRRLNSADYALIASHLSLQESAANDLLYNPGDDVDVVHFPCGPSLASYLVANEDGRDVETILVGREGAVGGIVSQGFLPAYTRIVVKFGGPFAQLPISKLEQAKLKAPGLRDVFARYADCLLAQIFQSTACNAIHSIEQRTAKWIISAMDRTGSDIVPLTHEVGLAYGRIGQRRIEGQDLRGQREKCGEETGGRAEPGERHGGSFLTYL